MQAHEAPYKASFTALDNGPREAVGVSARFLPKDAIAACGSFRDAVRLAWDNRVQRGMTQSILAAHLEIANSHMSSMLHRCAVDGHGKARRDLPARSIADFERVVGNRAISQYLSRMAMLTLMEEVIHSQRTP